MPSATLKTCLDPAMSSCIALRPFPGVSSLHRIGSSALPARLAEQESYDYDGELCFEMRSLGDADAPDAQLDGGHGDAEGAENGAQGLRPPLSSPEERC